MGDGVDYGDGSGNEKAEFTFTTGGYNLLNNIVALDTETIYTVDIVHKTGAWEGGSNFERLEVIQILIPDQPIGPMYAFSANFTVVPEPNSYALIAGIFGLAYIALKRRQI